jgi:hypothetical protein
MTCQLVVAIGQEDELNGWNVGGTLVTAHLEVLHVQNHCYVVEHVIEVKKADKR